MVSPLFVAPFLVAMGVPVSLVLLVAAHRASTNRVEPTQVLADNGVHATALEMVQALNDSVAGVDAGDCTDVYTVLITLMIGK